MVDVIPPAPLVEDPKRDYFLDICLKGANDIRKVLGLDDASYSRVFFTAHSHIKKYYLYGVLNEVEKAGVALMGFVELLKDTSGETHDRVSRNITQSIVDQQMLWVRKLTEIFVELILFEKLADEYFRHFLLVKHLDELNKIISDSKEFYGCENLNLKNQVNDAIQDIRSVESKIDTGKAWYLENKKGGGKHPGEKTQQTSFRDRLLLALPNAKPDQKLALGLTYGQLYGKSSQSLHPNHVHADPDVEAKEIEVGISQIGIISAHILILCRKLLKDRRRKGFVAQLARVFHKNTEAQKIMKDQVIRPNIKKGDFVIAYGDMGEVIQVKTSKYGYRSFKVRYLSQPPLAQIPVDEFPAIYVRLFCPRKKIVGEVVALISKATPGTKIDRKQVLSSARKTMREYWDELGGKERAYGRPELASQKIKEYLQKHKSTENP